MKDHRILELEGFHVGHEARTQNLAEQNVHDDNRKADVAIVHQHFIVEI